jgi:hypothetical protein
MERIPRAIYTKDLREEAVRLVTEGRFYPRLSMGGNSMQSRLQNEECFVSTIDIRGQGNLKGMGVSTQILGGKDNEKEMLGCLSAHWSFAFRGKSQSIFRRHRNRLAQGESKRVAGGKTLFRFRKEIR